MIILSKFDEKRPKTMVSRVFPRFFYDLTFWPTFSHEMTHIRTLPKYCQDDHSGQVWWRLDQNCELESFHKVFLWLYLLTYFLTQHDLYLNLTEILSRWSFWESLVMIGPKLWLLECSQEKFRHRRRTTNDTAGHSMITKAHHDLWSGELINYTFFESIFKPYYIQNHVITNSIIKRFMCRMCTVSVQSKCMWRDQEYFWQS